MSDTELKSDSLQLEEKVDNIDNLNISFGDLHKKYNKLKSESQELIAKNKVLKELIIKNAKENYQISLIEGVNLDTSIKTKSIGNSFYVQIILGILVIILSLGFHIVYLAVTSCLRYSDGNPGCWYQNWLGIDVHASFFIDLLLYSLIGIQAILIIFIIRKKLIEMK